MVVPQRSDRSYTRRLYGLDRFRLPEVPHRVLALAALAPAHGDPIARRQQDALGAQDLLPGDREDLRLATQQPPDREDDPGVRALDLDELLARPEGVAQHEHQPEHHDGNA